MHSTVLHLQSGLNPSKSPFDKPYLNGFKELELSFVMCHEKVKRIFFFERALLIWPISTSYNHKRDFPKL
jgi:hypothetical protein